MTGDVIEIRESERLTRSFKALGDPTQVRLVSLIAAHAGCEACVCDLPEPDGISPPTVSHLSHCVRSFERAGEHYAAPVVLTES